MGTRTCQTVAMFTTVALILSAAGCALGSTLPLTGAVISNNPLVPLPSPAVFRNSLPGRPVHTYTPQIHEERRTQKTVHSKFNVAVPVPVTRTQVEQDVHHSFVAQPYTVEVPVPVEQPVPVYRPYPVYQHEVEVQEPLQVVRHHQHTQRVHHFPLVKTADVVHHSVQPALIAAVPAVL